MLKRLHADFYHDFSQLEDFKELLPKDSIGYQEAD